MGVSCIQRSCSIVMAYAQCHVYHQYLSLFPVLFLQSLYVPFNSTNFSFTCIYIPFDRVPTTLRMRALRANVKPAHCKFKGRTFSANFLPLQAPVFFPQPTILALGRCQRLLNRFLYGHLHMKQQPRYAFSTVNRTLCGRVALL